MWCSVTECLFRSAPYRTVRVWCQCHLAAVALTAGWLVALSASDVAVGWPAGQSVGDGGHGLVALGAVRFSVLIIDIGLYIPRARLQYTTVATRMRSFCA